MDPTATLKPPRLIASLRAGFDAAANHVGLILFPIALDLFLWFGPHWSLRDLVQPLLGRMAALPAFDNPDAAALLTASQDAWKLFLDNFNLGISLRTFPVGIPSLMAGQMPTETPLGVAPTSQVESFVGAFLLWLAFALVGLVAGGLYFSLVARAAVRDDSQLTISRAGWISGQVILLTVGWIALILIVSIPAILMVTFLALFSPGVAQVALILASFFLVWALLPLLFSPHGIFVYRQNALLSMLTSARLVRFILPGTGLFFLAMLLLSQGLDILWQAPPPSSWLTLVGIAGHAFITTGLLAASFVYYRDAMRFVQQVLQHNVMSQSGTA